MTDTINNQIPFVPENTIDPAAGLNLSLNTIDALLQVLVQTVGANTPPAGVEGQRHIVGTAPTGAWAGQPNKLARYLDGAWQFFRARHVLNAVDGLWYVRSASTWSALAGGAPAWGSITGAIADQSDLALALDGKQDESANLAALSGLTGAADRLPYFTGAGALSLTTLTGLARDLLDDTTQSGMRSTLGLVKQTSAIDTTAGALLINGAHGLGTLGNTSVSRDCNTHTRGGFYRIAGTIINGPYAGDDLILLVTGAVDVVSQLAWSYSEGRMWTRTRGVSTWTAWGEVFTQRTILGTVSQSGGVPTGQLMERGSNGNGTYHRYADGTQITMRTIDYPAQAHLTQGGVTSGHSAGFVGEYIINITPEYCIGSGSQEGIGALLYNGMFVTRSTSSVSIASYSYRQAVDTVVRLQVMCVGRWY